jgi:Ca2+/Na+ antiporter
MVHTLAIVNIGLGLGGFFWLLLRTTRRRSEYPNEILLLLYATLALFFGLIASSVGIFIEGGTAFNTVAITLVKLFVLYVLWVTRSTKYRTGTRQSDGNPNADQNRDIE